MSRPQNEILDDIILASGGEITSATRNGKLRDWLNAVSQPTTRQAPNFNGVSQYANAGVITLSGSFEIEVTVNLLDNSIEQWIYGDWVAVMQSVALRVSSGNVQFFISPNGSGSESISIPISTGVRKIRCGLVSGVDIFIDVDGVEVRQATVRTSVFASGESVFFGRKNGAGFYFNGQIYNLKIGDGSVYSFPMDDGWANNPTMSNTGSGADGTFVNMTEAAWVEIPA